MSDCVNAVECTCTQDPLELMRPPVLTLADGVRGVAYSQTITITTYPTPTSLVQWYITGTLPTGLTFQHTLGNVPAGLTNTLSGTPTVASSFHFLVTAQLPDGQLFVHHYDVTIEVPP